MFDSLKKKISSWFKEDEKPTKGKKKTAKAKKEKVPKDKKPKIKKASQKKSKKEIILPIQIDPLLQTPQVDTEKLQELEAEVEEENIELEKEELEEPKENKSFFSSIKDKFLAKDEPDIEKDIKKSDQESFFSKIIKNISPGTTTLEQKHLDPIFEEIELTLLENNTALEVVDKIKENLSKDLIGIEIKKDKIQSTILESLKNSILEVLIEPPNLIDNINKSLGTYTIIFFGINGSGKTTSIAKLANYLKNNHISCVLAAADTFRAASIEQLETHANKIGVPIIKGPYGSDPSSIAFEARKYAEAHKIKVVLIDTAGRMYTKSNLMKEMEKIIKVSKPDLKIFVGESITGNDATEQAKMFNETAGIQGIVLTKADVDEKAGTILSVSYVTKAPLYFLGTGQEYKDFTVFTKKDVLKNLGL
jgi:fused signal recognition particle receptor